MSKATRRQARERLRVERERERARALRNRRLAILGAALLVVVLIVGGGYLYMRTAGAAGTYEGELAEQTLQDDGSVVMAVEGVEAPVVEVYADFQCPACASFEQTNGPTLNELAAEGEAIVHLRPVSIFAALPDPLSGNSLRGAAAARAAADHDRFVQYSEPLWENQPREGDPGFAPDDLVAWGDDVGITDPSFAERVDEESARTQEFVEYIDALRAEAESALAEEELQTMTLDSLMAWGDDNGVERPDIEGSYVQEVIDATSAVNARYPDGDNAFAGTPSVYLNGTLLGREINTVRGLRDAVSEAGPGTVDTSPAETQ